MKKMSGFQWFIILHMIISIGLTSCNTDELVLKPGNFKIYIPENEAEPVKLAVESLIRDFIKVLGYEPVIVHEIQEIGNSPALIIVNNSTRTSVPYGFKLKPLDGIESHRLYVADNKTSMVLNGADIRGTIYAIYTFSDKFLGVPPLWYWTSWVPKVKKSILIPENTDIFIKSPYVRYRTWLPNDTDMFSPWRKKSQENNVAWLETMLRCKLNTVEGYGANRDFQVSDETKLYSRYGLIYTTHHMVPVNASLWNWNDYWIKIKGMKTPPEITLKNKDKLIEFWRDNIDLVIRSKVEMLWVITFRGNSDCAFWAQGRGFKDAPESMEERAAIINEMYRIQLNLIKEMTGEEYPYVRVILYDELSDLLVDKLLDPPTGKNIIWQFSAARRDHFPNLDLVNFDKSKIDVNLGYYMNLQYFNTGSHLAQAESPWKMEANFRYVNSKSKMPLSFSVVNAGNLREHLMELTANAEMMWNFDSYNSNLYVLNFCKTYYGKKYSTEIARLYEEFYYSYWNQRKSYFEGIDRQFIFHDLRYSKVVRQISKKFKDGYNPNPLEDDPEPWEHVPGRTFPIIPEDHGVTNQIDAILIGMKTSTEKFGKVATACDKILIKIPKANQVFFNDNLRVQAHFMHQISKALYHYLYAYKYQLDKKILNENIEIAYKEALLAKEYLHEAEHGIFDSWYQTDALFNLSRFIEQIRLATETVN